MSAGPPSVGDTPNGMAQLLLSDPSILASLHNTLTPMGLLGQIQAAQAQEQEALSQRARDAASAATAAGSQYQQAAAAPPPQLDPLAQSLPTLIGNVASTLTKDPAYAQRAHQSLTQQHADLMTTRTQNLQALRDAWDTKARAAEAAGNLEASLGARTKSEQLGKTLDVLLQKQKEDAAASEGRLKAQDELNNIAAQGKNAMAVARINAAGKASSDDLGSLSDWADIRTMPDGTQKPYVDLSKISTPKAKQAITLMARRQGVPVVGDKEKSAFQLLDTMRGNMAEVTSSVIPKLPTGGGLSRLSGAGKNEWNAFWQNDPVLSGYPAIRTAAISTIQTLASLGKGLRINQAEINAAMNFDYPKITDNQETAKAKFAILGMMADHMEQAALGNPPSQAQVNQVLKATAALKAGKASDAASVAGSGSEEDKYRKVAQ